MSISPSLWQGIIFHVSVWNRNSVELYLWSSFVAVSVPKTKERLSHECIHPSWKYLHPNNPASPERATSTTTALVPQQHCSEWFGLCGQHLVVFFCFVFVFFSKATSDPRRWVTRLSVEQNTLQKVAMFNQLLHVSYSPACNVSTGKRWIDAAISTPRRGYWTELYAASIVRLWLWSDPETKHCFPVVRLREIHSDLKLHRTFLDVNETRVSRTPNASLAQVSHLEKSVRLLCAKLRFSWRGPAFGWAGGSI